MYIANQANNRISKIEDVEIHSTYPEEVRKELRDIYNRISCKAYNYGSTEKCENEIKRQQEMYLTDKPKEYHIIVNGVVFGVYDNETNAKYEFEGIKAAMIRDATLHSISESR